MFHLKMIEANPIAYITKNKSRLKIYNELNVFLQDKDNFEVELFNPTQSSILCRIKLNGNYISNTGIVLRPAERVFLDRFIDSNSKFLFNTYEVKNTPQNQSIIENNGDVEVEFYKEIPAQIYLGTSTITTGGLYNQRLGGYQYYQPFTTSTNNTLNLTSFTSTSTNCNYSSLSSTNTIDTGRIEKGNTSDQKFTSVNIDFDPYYFHSVKFKILPKSSKNISITEIRNYCSECGRKVKKEYKYCPSCGNKL
jgi:hypothetical protein